MSERPWSLWSVVVPEEVFRERLRDEDPAIRAQWQYLRLRDVLDNWESIQGHRRPQARVLGD